MQYLFELRIPERSPHDLHVMHEHTGAQQFIQMTEIRL
jgi:hypothetical protein